MPNTAKGSVAVYLYTVDSDISDKKKKWNQGALLPLGLPKLTSHSHWCWVEEHIICEPRAIAEEQLFPSVNDPQVESLGCDSTEVRVHILLRAKQTPSQAAWLYCLMETGSHRGQVF